MEGLIATKCRMSCNYEGAYLAVDGVAGKYIGGIHGTQQNTYRAYMLGLEID